MGENNTKIIKNIRFAKCKSYIKMILSNYVIVTLFEIRKEGGKQMPIHEISEQADSEAIQALLGELERQKKALRNIKTFTDAYFDRNVTLTVGKEDMDVSNSIYDVRSYMGMIHSNAYEGLNLSIPRI